MKVLRNRLLVTLILAAVVLTFGSSAALAAYHSASTAAGTTSVSSGDRPAATPTSGEPDLGNGSIQPQQKSLRPVYDWDNPQGGLWWTWISRIWASWSPRDVG
jgi:hypothetical protein